jgi:hypothetical protein
MFSNRTAGLLATKWACSVPTSYLQVLQENPRKALHGIGRHQLQQQHAHTQALGPQRCHPALEVLKSSLEVLKS